MFCFGAQALDISSTAFENGGYISAKYTCDSSDMSPPLFWHGVPDNTKSLVIICDDPDAAYESWVHWIIFNIPVTLDGLGENMLKEKSLPKGIIQGMNDFGKIGYNGACPPAGKAHRYFFKLYALNTMLSISGDDDLKKENVVSAMQGHILEETKIIGLYER
ncbi:MAG: YbhB/YbcL family Raf kinase inhibitor-like protein [Candidatus Omnitrophica bacterium]|nr:YbhB/YbcL family Raf kinase inhibitor-like protein [Candidatus Omnitrophota bacterium]